MAGGRLASPAPPLACVATMATAHAAAVRPAIAVIVARLPVLRLRMGDGSQRAWLAASAALTGRMPRSIRSRI
jgi:hypothetical protein